MPHSPLKRALPTAFALIAATPFLSTDAAAAEKRTYAESAGDINASLRTRYSRHTPKLSAPAMAIYKELRSARLPVSQPQPHNLACIAARAARIMVTPTTYVAPYKNQQPSSHLVKRHLGEALAAYFGVGLAGHAADKAESGDKSQIRTEVFSAFEQVQRSWDGRTSTVNFNKVLSQEAVPRTQAGHKAAADALNLVAKSLGEIYR